MLKGTVATPGRLTGRLLLSPQARAGSSQRGVQALPAPAQTNQTRDIRGLRGSDGEREATDYVEDGNVSRFSETENVKDRTDADYVGKGKVTSGPFLQFILDPCSGV